MIGPGRPEADSAAARSRRVVPVAVGAAAGSSFLALAALFAQLAAGGEVLANYLVVDVALGVVSSVLGGYLVVRRPTNAMGWLFALSGTAYAVTAAVTAWVTGTLVRGWPGLALAAWTAEWVYVLAFGPQITLLLLLFPDGRPPTARWRPVAWLSGVSLAVLTSAFMLAPEVHVDATVLIPNPVGGAPWADQLVGPALILLGLCAAASAAGLVLRLIRAQGAERRRIAPYVATALVVVVGVLTAVSLPAPWEAVVQTVLLPTLPLAAAVCIVRYRLFDLELVVRRSLVWLGLSALIIIGYAVVVEATANLLRREAGLPESLIAAGAVAAAFGPARAWLQRSVGRALYGRRDDPATALRELGQAMAVTAHPDAALDRAARQVAEALASPWVAIEVDRDAEAPHRTEAGMRPAWADGQAITRTPLLHAGAAQGALVVCRRSPKEPLSRRDSRLLEDLSYPLATMAAAFRLTDDVRRSRERLVVAREEERRRLRHDLHDELGPVLASFTLQLDAAVLRQRRTGAAPTELLAELRATADEAVATVRRAVEHLRPPALDELGLVGSITTQLHRLETPDGPHLTLDVPEQLPALRAATEVAVHRIVTEAVTNAVRHAGARMIEVRLVPDGAQALVVEVRDDGHGIPPDGEPGVGTVSMRERAEELGGRCEISPGDRVGTLVRAVLPLDGVR